MHRVTWEAQSNKLINNFKKIAKNSLALQWLGLHTLTAKGAGSISGQGTKTPASCVVEPGKKKKKGTIMQ